MRERVAKVFAVTLTSLMVTLAAAFAARQNAPGAALPPPTGGPPESRAPPEPVEPASMARGRAAFAEHGCARCHRMEEVGNPRSPLDGIGARLGPDRIRAFILADPSVRDLLPASVARTKSAYARIAETELDALVAYLAASRE